MCTMMSGVATIGLFILAQNFCSTKYNLIIDYTRCVDQKYDCMNSDKEDRDILIKRCLK